MRFVPMLDMLQHAKSAGCALPSFCVCNAETMVAVLHAAEKLNSTRETLMKRWEIR